MMNEAENKMDEAEKIIGETERKTTDFVMVRYSCEKRMEPFLLNGVDTKNGDNVIVETEAGNMLGQVVGSHRQMEIIQGAPDEWGEAKEKLMKVLRIANEKDREDFKKNEEFAKESAIFCKEKILARKLPMKIINVEVSLDRSKIVFYFTAENRVDFRELVKDLVQKLRMRIELRQINSRCETRMMGGIGPCGRELCCANISANLDRVSIKMAKEQGVAINPEKISGLCGRLMCCLAYEFETYTNIRATMPRMGCAVCTSEGKGRVVGQNIVAGEVAVEMEDGRIVNVPPGDIDKSKGGDEKK